MSQFVYLITEGVQDVAFIGRMLVLFHGAHRLRLMEELPAPQATWMGSFSWPIRGRKGTEIDRFAVPAPTFYGLPSGAVVALRSAEGIDKIKATLTLDRESFTRSASHPETVGLVLDSDDAPAADRLKEVTGVLTDVGLPAPARLAEIDDGPPRVGVFVVPAPEVRGTLEDLLLHAADHSYPALTASAREFADHWRRECASLDGEDWKAIRKPAGPRKAAVAAVTAILRPGYAAQNAIEQSGWFRAESRAVPALAPCLAFLEALLTTSTPGPAVAPALATSP